VGANDRFSLDDAALIKDNRIVIAPLTPMIGATERRLCERG
jgi:nicotinate-nucleotide pyrophosphorylase